MLEIEQGSEVQGYLFDAFGTLVRITQPRKIYKRLFASTELKPSRCREIALTENLTLAELAARVGAHADVAMLEAELAEELASITLINGPALEALQRAMKAGKPVGLVSNLAQPYADPVLRLLPQLRAYIWSFEVGLAKPDPRIFHLAANRLAMPPQHIVMTGDTLGDDIRGARAIGMMAIKV